MPRSVAVLAAQVLAALVCYGRRAEMFMHGHKKQEDTQVGQLRGSCSAIAFACGAERKP